MDRKHAIILAGGTSRRFGTDKTRLSWNGRPLIHALAATLRAEGFAITLLSNGASHLVPYGDCILDDPFPTEGPLQAIYGALSQRPYTRNLVVAADMPLLTPAMCQLLWVESATSVVTYCEGSHLPGVYARSLTPLIGTLLAQGERRLQVLGRSVRAESVRVVEHARWRTIDPKGRSLVNINTAADWDYAQKLLQEEPTWLGLRAFERRNL